MDNGGSTATMPIVWWRPETYARVLEISIDKDNLFPTFDEWQSAWEKRYVELLTSGFPVVKVMIDPEELAAWARAEGRDIDGKTRAAFVMLVHERENRHLH